MQHSVFVRSPFVCCGTPSYLLKRDNNFTQGFVRSVFDFVPMEGLQILFGRL